MKIPPPVQPIDVEEAKRLRTIEGLNAVEIARRLGCAATSIRQIFKKHGVPLRPRRKLHEVPTGEKLYHFWRALRSRCHNERDRSYPRYGGRGFRLCREWQNFWCFYDWAIKAGYVPRMSLEIKGRSRCYSPATSRWITEKERPHRDGSAGGTQPRILVTAFGETKSIPDWAKDRRCKVTSSALRQRLERGVVAEYAIAVSSGPLPKDPRLVGKWSSPNKRLDWERIADLRTRSGLGTAEIAERVGASVLTIQKGLKQRGLSRGPHRTPNARSLCKIWDTIKSRCENVGNRGYRYYGARGVRLCREWQDVRKFLKWAEESGYQPGLCLARRQGTKIYSPRNCWWVTRVEASHRRSGASASMPPRWTVEAFGECKGPAQWSRDARCLVTLTALINRLRLGWPAEDAISTPPANTGGRNTMFTSLKAFGVTKNLSDWSRDPRCKVTVTTLDDRLRSGVPAEDAITTPPYALHRQHKHSRSRPRVGAAARSDE